ncbi:MULTISPECIES: hypothetical protein [Bradyrhizobium]|uniref:hypothetical protein n=1 Tax=Bradyrhizobium TaxID=374 RepID=UPI00042175F6|nr:MULTISPECIES: hypothetical protein [Bradyrhizobium]MBR0995732.1 hypothetical protein [Bradyrhizobium liaoningense]MCP1740281.1 hypothetical protein [Bradyrhizobium japonicum]MCP1857957.1 hypothetical protein [Bradyrhizobium japonicum]MCP1888771.1 hypothetical protein [Bradyrhizobium japonicum]MCW2321747.1 hypothetical protein [Bradyrhizobium japonicum]
MRAEQEHLDGLPERQLADRLMSIAESRSVRALGIACCSAITELTGSPTVGLYLLDGLEPELVYSRHVAEGLLDNYRAGFWKRDPVLDCIMTQGRAVDGETVIGPQQWRQSVLRDAARVGLCIQHGRPVVVRAEDRRRAVYGDD